jgi:Tfp pilus assembly protein PilX
MLIMGEYVTSRVANGMSHSDAFNEMEAALYSGELSLEDGLEEATERWVRSVRAKRGH